MTLHSKRANVNRLPSRGFYDRETLYSILDANFLCHVGFEHAGSPVIIPTAYGRKDDTLYLHGSVKSQHLLHIANGGEACIAVTELNGIVLARSLFHSSMNYRSVVLYGRGSRVEGVDEKNEALQIVSESIWKGRWEEARKPSPNELLATMVVAFPIVEGSAKIRTGGPNDNLEDYDLNIWAGVIPLSTHYGKAIPDEKLNAGITLPPSITRR